MPSEIESIEDDLDGSILLKRASGLSFSGAATAATGGSFRSESVIRKIH